MPLLAHRRVLVAFLALALAGLAEAGVSAWYSFANWHWILLGTAAMAGAAVWLGRRTILTLTLARGITLAIVSPALYPSTRALLHLQWPARFSLIHGIYALSLLAIVVSRSQVVRQRDSGRFDPVHSRGFLLAGATWATAAATLSVVHGALSLKFGEPGIAAIDLAFAALGFAAVAATLRMRAWGVLAGLAGNVGITVFALTTRRYFVFASPAPVAALFFAVPLVMARFARGRLP